MCGGGVATPGMGQVLEQVNVNREYTGDAGQSRKQ